MMITDYMNKWMLHEAIVMIVFLAYFLCLIHHLIYHWTMEHNEWNGIYFNIGPDHLLSSYNEYWTQFPKKIQKVLDIA